MKNQSKNRGMAIPMVLFVIVMVFIFGLIVNTVATQNLMQSSKNVYNLKALYAAESGLAKGRTLILTDKEWGKNGTEIVAFSDIKLDEEDEETGRYTVRIYNYLKKGGITSITDEPGITEIPAHSCLIVSEGKVVIGGVERAVKRSGVLLVQGNLYHYGIFGDGLVDLSNCTYKAYNSESGTLNIMPGSARVGSNGSGYSAVGQKVMIDSGGSVSVNGVITITNLLWGVPGVIDVPSTIPREPAPPQTLPSITLPDNLSVNSAYPVAAQHITYYDVGAKKPGNVTVQATILHPGDYRTAAGGTLATANKTIVLKGPGSFIFNNINLQGGNNIIVDNASSEPIKVYITGNVDCGGNSELGFISKQYEPGAANVPQPAKLQLFVTNSTNPNSAIKIHGNTGSACTLYAPYSNVTVSGSAGEFYGAVIGKTINMNGGPKIWYDTALEKEVMEDALVTSAWMRF